MVLLTTVTASRLSLLLMMMLFYDIIVVVVAAAAIVALHVSIHSANRTVNPSPFSCHNSQCSLFIFRVSKSKE